MKKLPIYTQSTYRNGWIKYDCPFPDGFSEQSGPYLFREPGDSAGVRFIATKVHENYIGLVHGGALMSLVDVTMWDICQREIEAEFLLAATITNTVLVLTINENWEISNPLIFIPLYRIGMRTKIGDFLAIFAPIRTFPCYLAKPLYLTGLQMS